MFERTAYRHHPDPLDPLGVDYPASYSQRHGGRPDPFTVLEDSVLPVNEAQIERIRAAIESGIGLNPAETVIAESLGLLP